MHIKRIVIWTVAVAILSAGMLFLCTPCLMQSKSLATAYQIDDILAEPEPAPPAEAQPDATAGCANELGGDGERATSWPEGWTSAEPPEHHATESGSGVPMAPSTTTRTIDEVIRGMEWGETAFDVPEAMSKGKPYQVVLALSLSLGAQALVSETFADDNGVQTARARVSDTMQANLTGVGFSIQANTPDTQVVSGLDTTTWTWDVIPQASGQRTLHMTLSAIMSVKGQQSLLVVRSLDKSVVVKVSPSTAVSDFVGKNWQWLWATILVPAVGLAWKLRRRKP